MISLLVWSALFLLLWDKRQAFQSRPDRVSFVLGCGLMSVLLVVGGLKPGATFLSLFPLLAFGGWFLMFVGVFQWRLYVKEFVILVAASIPKFIPNTAFGLAPVTAKASAFMLWYLGYPTTLRGVYLQVPNGGVEVVPSCSGISLITYMVCVAIIFVSVFPPRRSQAIGFVLAAILLGFGMNAVRVAILALLSPPKFSASFHYWHSASGASLFVLLTLVLYGVLFFTLAKPVARGE